MYGKTYIQYKSYKLYRRLAYAPEFERSGFESRYDTVLSNPPGLDCFLVTLKSNVGKSLDDLRSDSYIRDLILYFRNLT